MMMILQLCALYLLNIVYYDPQFSFVNTHGHALYFPLQNKHPAQVLILHSAFLGFPPGSAARPALARGGHASLGAQPVVSQTLCASLPHHPSLGINSNVIYQRGLPRD